MESKIQLIGFFAVSLQSCCSVEKIGVGASSDTVFIARHHYDSVLIDRHTVVETFGDTLIIDRTKTERHYSIHTDTLWLSHADTVVLPVIKEPPNALPTRVDVSLCAALLIGVVVGLWLLTMKKKG